MSAGNGFTTCLWFDGKAEEAAKHYTSIFKNSKINKIHRYLEAGKEQHGHEPGSVMTVQFEINGQRFVGLNAGSQTKFNMAVSLMVHCADQAEVDYYWEKLGEGGDPSQGACGWIVDKYGLWWQVVPEGMVDMFGSEDKAAANRAMSSMMSMKKLDINVVRDAFEGK